MKFCQRKRDNSNRQIPRRSFLTATSAAAAALLAGHGNHAGGAFGLDNDSAPELTRLSAKKLGEMIRARKVSSSEVIEAHIARIEEVDPKINAVVFKAYDDARRRAQLADDTIENGDVDWERQPLFGVPVTIKDEFETERIPSTCGMPGLKHHVPKADATAVRRLKDAGAIVLAKTNVPTLCVHCETDNLLHGRTNNPYDLSRTPGGSSGGEAAVIAACGSPMGLGADGGGSIRLPAHFCGIAGLRPAWGRVSLGGSIVPKPQDYGRYFTAGPLARYVEDLALMLPIISGPDPRDPFTFPVPLRDPQDVDLPQLRVTYWSGDGIEEIPQPTSETVATVENAAKALTKTGADVDHERPPHLKHLLDLFDAVWDPEKALDNYPKALKEYGVDAPDRLSTQLLENARKRNTRIPVEQKRTAKEKWLPEFQTAWLEYLEKYDVLLCPVNSFPAMKHYTTWEQIYAFSFALTVSLVPKVPAGSIRCGSSPKGLPIGVQVVSKPYREDIVLAVMSYLEKELGGWHAPPI